MKHSQPSDTLEELYFAGDASLLICGPRIAIVGARKASSRGLSAAERLADTLTRHDIIVISGLAEGIDTAGL